jgi:hypothetical protein
MTTKESLLSLIEHLPAERLQELLSYARYLAVKEEADTWHELGLRQLAKAYGNNEPEYTEADIKGHA